MRLSLITEWIYADGRDRQLYKDYSAVRDKMTTGRAMNGKMSINEFQQLLDDLERLVLRIHVDRDDKEQWQKDQIRNLLEHIAEARKITNPANIYKFIHILVGIIPTLMK